MNDLAGICIFITIMTALSIPIIAVLKHKPKNPLLEGKIAELEKRVIQLETENASRAIDLDTVKKELAFTAKLIEKN